MTRRPIRLLAALAAILAVPAAAEAQAPIELTGYVQVERETIDPATGARRTERVDPVAVLPGDRLILGTRFANRGPAPVEGFVLSNPVPAAVTVAPEIDPALLVSVDGGTTWGRLSDLAVVAQDGSQRAAAAGDITHVRWVLAEVAAGSSGQVEFPVKVK